MLLILVTELQVYASAAVYGAIQEVVAAPGSSSVGSYTLAWHDPRDCAALGYTTALVGSLLWNQIDYASTSLAPAPIQRDPA